MDHSVLDGRDAADYLVDVVASVAYCEAVSVYQELASRPVDLEAGDLSVNVYREAGGGFVTVLGTAKELCFRGTSVNRSCDACDRCSQPPVRIPADHVLFRISSRCGTFNHYDPAGEIGLGLY